MKSHKFISGHGPGWFGRMNAVAGDKPADPVNLAAVMTSTCGGIRWGRAEGQYLFKLITRGCRGCVCARIGVLFMVHVCERDLCVILQSLSIQTCEYVSFAWASVWPWPAVCFMAYSSRSASLTFQLWRFWHASGSMTRQLRISLPPLSTDCHLSGEAQAPPRRWKTTSDHFWQIIYLLVGLPVSHTHYNIYVLFFLKHVLLLLTHPFNYCDTSLPSHAICPAGKHIWFCTLADLNTFRAIIWVIFYRDMRIVLMEPGRNITWGLAVGGCWYRQAFSRASLVLLHKSFDTLLLPLWQL